MIRNIVFKLSLTMNALVVAFVIFVTGWLTGVVTVALVQDDTDKIDNEK